MISLFFRQTQRKTNIQLSCEDLTGPVMVLLGRYCTLTSSFNLNSPEEYREIQMSCILSANAGFVCTRLVSLLPIHRVWFVVLVYHH